MIKPSVSYWQQGHDDGYAGRTMRYTACGPGYVNGYRAGREKAVVEKLYGTGVEATFHKKIARILNNRQQGYVMQSFREALEQHGINR